MSITPASAPSWIDLAPHDRYQRLQTIRRVWWRSHCGEHEDRRGRTISLDGASITDIPSFYLALGEAVNGPNGYFGGDLEALADCLCGGFGVLPPLTIHLSHFDEVRNALDSQAWLRFRAESFREAVKSGADAGQLVDWGYFPDSSEISIAQWTAKYESALNGESVECDLFGSYFDKILEVFASHNVIVVTDF